MSTYIKKYMTIEATKYFIFLIKISHFAKFFFLKEVTKAAKSAKSRRRDDVSLEVIVKDFLKINLITNKIRIFSKLI